MKSSKLDWLIIAPRALFAALLICLFSIHSSAQTATPSEAIALQEKGKWREASEAWRAVIGANPKDAGAYASLGVVLSKEMKYSEAASAYETALSLNPKLPGIELNLGLAEFKQGRFDAAIPTFHAVLATDPRNQQASIL
ncbi:MAG: tetratricopeptide repeat protein, partial [Candidatus Sulfotelmatobacter sp.]